MSPPAKARILVLTPRYPYPPIGGDRLRIYQVCRQLARHHSLTLLSLCESREEMAAPAPEDGLFDRIERVFLPKWRSYLNTLLALPTRLPLQVAYYRSGAFRRLIGEHLPGHDLCLAHLIRTGHYMRGLPQPSVLEMTDAISLNYTRIRETQTPWSLKSLVFSLEARRLRPYELRILRDFSLVSLVSEVDRSFLTGGGESGNVIVSSNGVDVDNFAPIWDQAPKEMVVLFIGNMETLQNMDAALFFAGQVLPILRGKAPMRFRVIGRIRPKGKSQLESFDGVEVLANVTSIPKAAGTPFAAVAPIRLGAGVQNKVLEYMAMGLPAVCSPIAHEGIQAVAGQHLLLASSPKDFAEQLWDLWKDPARAADIGREARRFIELEHDWAHRLEPLLQGVDQLLSTGGRP